MDTLGKLQVMASPANITDEDLALIQKSYEQHKIESLPVLGTKPSVIEAVQQPEAQHRADIQHKFFKRVLDQYKHGLVMDTAQANPGLVDNLERMFVASSDDTADDTSHTLCETYLSQLGESAKQYGKMLGGHNLLGQLEEDLLSNGCYGHIGKQLGLDRDTYAQLFGEMTEVIKLDKE